MSDEPSFKGTGCLVALAILVATMFILGPDAILTLFGQ